MTQALDFIQPNWPAPKNVKCLSTIRTGGVSLAPYDALNLGLHVADNIEHVQLNRQRLVQYLPAQPLWLNQIHGTHVIHTSNYKGVCDADASFANTANQVCTVMTADCLPVLFCNTQGTQVAAAHAGWRGLLDGVLENTVNEFDQADQVMAWLGPAIGPDVFEVGQEVKDAFTTQNPACAVCFKPSNNAKKWLADLYSLARVRLLAAGVKRVYGGEFCTFTDESRFFSYRRDGVTGRMASCIWLAE
ncbi:MAG: peptidoglycan editing factor PgeF [Bermanella sp.]